VYNNDDNIIRDLLGCYPEEGCGIILNKRGKLIWRLCKNISDDPENSFIIDPTEYIKASLEGDIYSIVHSHVDSSSEPGEKDIKTSNFLGIPYTIFSIPEGTKTVYTPKKISKPLLGREYCFGKTDCYSLVRDYYHTEFNITLPTIPFEDDWWDLGLNYFDDLFEKFGFIEVDTPQKGDGIIFKVYSGVPNHCGIYIGEGNFLHHAVNRLSCRESLYDWKKFLVRYVRCKQFI
jgi:cell wall-associated NlpC family hydrolase